MSLEVAAAAFKEGYRQARSLGDLGDPDRLRKALLALGSGRAPFALEGAAMAWKLADESRHRDPRLAALRSAWPAAWHPFIELGVGCALARLGRSAPDDEMALDGYGFQVGLTEGTSGSGQGGWLPERAERGRGRALWFVTGGDVRACAVAIRRARHPWELWRGVGTACVFAGDPRRQADAVATLCEPWASHVVAGAEAGAALWRSLEGPIPARVQDVIRLIGATAP